MCSTIAPNDQTYEVDGKSKSGSIYTDSEKAKLVVKLVCFFMFNSDKYVILS